LSSRFGNNFSELKGNVKKQYVFAENVTPGFLINQRWVDAVV
jgi:hypothetical protein